MAESGCGNQCGIGKHLLAWQSRRKSSRRSKPNAALAKAWMVGCSCHGIQLPPRHVLPLVRERRQVAAGDDESDSSSDSGSESSSDSLGDAKESGDCRSGAEPPEACPTIDPHQQERQALRTALEQLFSESPQDTEMDDP